MFSIKFKSALNLWKTSSLGFFCIAESEFKLNIFEFVTFNMLDPKRRTKNFHVRPPSLIVGIVKFHSRKLAENKLENEPFAATSNDQQFNY